MLTLIFLKLVMTGAMLFMACKRMYYHSRVPPLSPGKKEKLTFNF